MTRALVAIGISNAPPLEHLDSAIDDAEKIAAWADAIGYEYIKSFIDKDGSVVRAASILDHCKTLLEIKDLEKLVIFFSGHGYSPLPGHEVWLLSGWNTDANEAINASTSVQIALRFARPQISFIADACRTTWNDAQGTTGQVILPKPQPPSANSQVDQFYATAFGDVSQQYQPAQLRASYGVFSQEVLNGLKGAAAVKRDSKLIVTSRSLQDHLRKVVPEACQKIPNAVVQYPTTNPQWLEPADVYAEVAAETPIFPQPHDLGRLGGLFHNFELRRTEPRRLPREVRRSKQDGKSLDKALTATLARRDEGISSDARRYDAAIGRESYETGTGLTIVGAGIESVVLSGNFAESFVENAAQQIRISGVAGADTIPAKPCTALMRISDGPWRGYWIAMPVFPQLIGTALIDTDGFSSLNYRPARRFEYNRNRGKINAALAEAAAMFRRGVLPKRDRVNEIIDILREDKFDNPALAILAAYCCQQQGDLAQITDMEKYEIGRGPYTPYDLLLVSGEQRPASKRHLVGMLPFMSTGWGLLDAAGFHADPRLRSLAQKVVPSLWTMAKPDAGEALAGLVKPG